jgi:hypothetical protein
MCILSSLAGVAATKGDINIFTQIGFVVLVGLASKNAILIVEFAKHKYESGMSRHEATLAASGLRLRPILMTSFAFILGVVPLLVGTGAGFEMRRRLGVAVFSGMLGVTFFGIFLTPVFFNVIEWFKESAVHTRIGRAVGIGLSWALPVMTLGLSLIPDLLAAGWKKRRIPFERPITPQPTEDRGGHPVTEERDGHLVPAFPSPPAAGRGLGEGGVPVHETVPPHKTTGNGSNGNGLYPNGAAKSSTTKSVTHE